VSSARFHDYFVDLDQAVDLLASGRALLVPTDTVWGLAVKVDEQTSPEPLFGLKRRDHDKSIPWLVASRDELQHYCIDVPVWAGTLAERFWPGPLTLVCWASKAAPQNFIAADGSLALRMPEQPETLELIRSLGAPLATSSANRQGEPPARSLEDLDPELVRQVGAILAAADPESASESAKESSPPTTQPSTIVSCLDNQPLILRFGALQPSVVLGCIGETTR